MNFNHPNKNNSTTLLRVVCAIVFCFFTFFWFYFLQSDLLAYAQHVLSHGATHYERLPGALLLTFALQLLQLGVFAVTRLSRRAHWLTYLPSFLLLTALTSGSPAMAENYSWGYWVWLLPLLLFIWVLLVLLARALQPYEPDIQRNGLFSRVVWINVLMMSVQMIGAGCSANANDVFHYRLRAEHLALQGCYDNALKVGWRSTRTDEHLLTVRAYALARQGRLGDELFHYAMPRGGCGLLPLRQGSVDTAHTALNDSIYRMLGGRPAQPMSEALFLHRLLQLPAAKPVAADYALCHLLLAEELDAFARMLPRYYAVNDSLPLHYREALTLYGHQRSYPQTDYRNAVMETDYADWQKLLKQCASGQSSQVQLYLQYGKTYWYYYSFHKK